MQRLFHAWPSVLVILAALFCLPAHAAQFESCMAQIPLGAPVVTAPGSRTPLCRDAYAVLHDNDRREPLWVSYVLTGPHSLGCARRKDKFRPDPDLPARVRAELSDYRSSGYDRGHLAPNGDFAWDENAAEQSFYLSNMVPQLHTVNAGNWEDLEKVVRAWSVSRGDMLVMAGPIFDQRLSGTIGPNRLPIPAAFWKVIVDQRADAALAFIMPNVDPEYGYSLGQYQVSLGEVELRASLRLPLGAQFERSRKPEIWPADLAGWARVKGTSCRGGGAVGAP